MRGIGVITTSNDIKFKYIPNFIYHRMPQKMLNTMCLTFKSTTYEKVNFADTGVTVNIARLPVTEKQVHTLVPGDLQNICNVIIDDFEKEGINYVFLCESLGLYRRIIGDAYERVQQYKNRDKRLLISLCVDISKKISKILGVNLFEIRVKIVESSYSWKSKLLINILSSYAKYISLVTQDVKSAQKDMDGIYDETGLTVHVSSKFSRSDEVEMIYMLDDFNNYVTKDIFGLNTILFLLNANAVNNSHTKGIIIDSIDVKMPPEIDEMVNTLGLTDSEEFMEAILSIKIGSGISDKSNTYYEEMRNNFNQLGYQINALKMCNTLVNLGRFDRIAKNLKAVK